jgi:hypothetical protein
MATVDIKSLMQGRRRPGAGPETGPPAQAMTNMAPIANNLAPIANKIDTPDMIAARRQRWGNALEGAGDVYTPSPLLAGAKALTMGLGGYQQTRADKDMAAGQQGYSQKLAQMLESGKFDPTVMADSFATPGGTRMAEKMYDRANPEPMSPQQQLEMKINEARLAQIQQEGAWAAEDRNKPKVSEWTDKDGNRWTQTEGGEAAMSWDAPDSNEPEWVNIPGPGGKGTVPINIKDPKGQAIYDQYMSQFAEGAQGGTPPQTLEDMDAGLKVGKNFEGSTGFQRYQLVAPTLNSMYKSINDPTAMADLDFVYGLAKILDPTSVVRESEAGMVIDAQGIAPSVLGRLNKFMTGEQAMSPKVRAELFSVAQRRAEELRLQADQERGHFAVPLQKQGLDPETYLQQLTPTPKWEQQNMGEASGYRPPAPPAAAQSGAVTQPQTQPIPQAQPVPQSSQDDAVIQRQQSAPPGVPGRLWSQLQNDPEFLADIQAAQGNPQAMQELMQILQQEFPDYFTGSGW